jgi:hypothetical protein
VPALLQYSLTRAGGGVVENFAALHGSKAGDIAAFDVKDAELSQDTVARRHNDDDAGHIAWLMLLARPAFPLARATKDSRRPQRTLPAGTLVCEGHFLEYMYNKPRGASEWQREGALPQSANAYYVSKEVAILAVDIPGSKCLGHFWRGNGMEVEEVSARAMERLRRPDQPEASHAKRYSVPAACDALMQLKLGIYSPT